jgi:hypothetical protein
MITHLQRFAERAVCAISQAANSQTRTLGEV